ncbi:type IV toxin-antitoxin system AbiEi family antitoxin domain-containing protein [Berryella intestinalis]|uniref:type IV toxin-antitoxin system AbiEi family antitoxin domain-containing protein n=1 Tax=Berryella intestinalis TaxID=1531429 RepID=UPI00197FCCA9|nr:type IV toxin-antitoxin system AbiEi family antitoxin domain-containing protein [Berryella intestinalis]
MTKATRIYDAVDGFGLITSAQAAELGMSNAELVQQARMGRFTRVARGVYRVSVWPPQPEAPYAIAVKAVGDEALLYGESVVALLDLTPTDTSAIWVATPKRVRRTIDISAEIIQSSEAAPASVKIIRSREIDPVSIKGIPCQPITDAIISASTTMGINQAREALVEAMHRGYITRVERADTERGFARQRKRAARMAARGRQGKRLA